ncbi:MAG: hypothetical protein OXC48_12620 [Endozoicomonadaceae bacterium]|nr:hypothetical protein [Endozoicomonadaceae bacterium]
MLQTVLLLMELISALRVGVPGAVLADKKLMILKSQCVHVTPDTTA